MKKVKVHVVSVLVAVLVTGCLPAYHIESPYVGLGEFALVTLGKDDRAASEIAYGRYYPEDSLMVSVHVILHRDTDWGVDSNTILVDIGINPIAAERDIVFRASGVRFTVLGNTLPQLDHEASCIGYHGCFHRVTFRMPAALREGLTSPDSACCHIDLAESIFFKGIPLLPDTLKGWIQ